MGRAGILPDFGIILFLLMAGILHKCSNFLLYRKY